MTKVVARVSDGDGVEQVVARYRLNSTGGVYESAPLFDDGAHDDGAAGDGLYAGTIPGQGDGTKVVFYIEATDDTGEVRTFPREAPGRTLVYEHDTPFTTNSVHALRLIHDTTTWSRLRGRQLHSNHLVDATFVFNESEVYYNVGTRFRGSPWNRPPTPRMYRIKFPKDNRYRGRRAINISRYGSSQREYAARYSVWRNSTQTSTTGMNRGEFIRFRDSERTSTMEQIDPTNGDYLRMWFPGDDDGLLYKITGQQTFDDNGNHQGNLIEWANYSYQTADKGRYRWNWNPRTRETEDNFSPLPELMRALSGGSTALDNELEDIMDVEQFLRVYAGRCAHDDWDTISIGNGQNAYTYFASNEGRFKLLPWDMDHSWGNANSRIYPDADSRMRNVINRPKYRRIYLGILNEMINGRGSEPGYWATGEMVSKVLDRTSSTVSSDGVGSAGSVRNFINARTGSLRSQLPSNVSFRITTTGDRTIDDATVQVEGTAWVDVHQILVNGEPPFAMSWTSTTRWRATIQLEPGDNDLTFLAFDSDANFVGADDISFTSTSGWATPEITDVQPAQGQPGEQVTITGIEFHDGITVLFDGEEALAIDFDEDADPTTLVATIPLVAPGLGGVQVRNTDNRTSDPAAFTILPPPPQFVRGDANLSRRVDVSDAIRILGILFGGMPAPCLDAADVDNNEVVNITDAVVLLAHLFQRGPALSAPYPDEGWEPESEGPLD
ncbi:MAG: CotH kinase family protein, partial [Planctomycetota bacterium]